ncbi:MAG: hypothetical protein EBX39_05725 [Actinobacteria bacterium]|nr:hypothetical protein [Actinomycetota bacterium]
MKSQMKSADRSGARLAIIVGTDELEAGVVTVRPLREDRPQSTVARDRLVDEVRSVLSATAQPTSEDLP